MSTAGKRRGTPSLARRTAVGGIAAALGITAMYLGSVVDVLDLSAAAFASFLLIAVISESGRRDALCVFAVTALLSWLLLPNRSPALLYTVFLGYYPMLKITLDRLGRAAGTVLKLVILNAAVTAAYFISHLIFASGADDTSLLWLWYPLVNAAFIIYDIALGRAVRLWVLKLRRVFMRGR